MDKLEMDDFLGSVRELRREAEEKLRENRYYLAIQKLDEITEAVEKHGLTPEQAMSLDGVAEAQALAVAIGAEPITVDGAASAAAAGAAAAAAAVASTMPAAAESAATGELPTIEIPTIETESVAAPALEVPELEVPTVEMIAVEAPALEVPELEVPTVEMTAVETPAIEVPTFELPPIEVSAAAVAAPVASDILPNWWRSGAVTEPATSAEAPAIDVAAAAAAPEIAVPQIAVPELPAGGVDASIFTVPEVEVIPEVPAIEVGASVIDAGVQTPVIDTAPTGYQMPDFSLPEITAHELEMPDEALPEIVEMPVLPELEAGASVIDAEASMPVVEMPAIGEPLPEPVLPEVSLPEVSIPQVVLPEVSLPEITLPEVSAPEVAVPEATVPEPSAAEPVVPSIDLESLGLVVPRASIEDVLPAVAQQDEPALDAIIEAASEPSAPDLPTVGMDDASVSAAIAAGAAAIAGGAATQSVEPAPAPVQVQAEVAPAAVAAQLVPEKLAFPTEAATDGATPRILHAEEISYHPDYGAKRGGLIRRFFNSLKGKDYI